MKHSKPLAAVYHYGHTDVSTRVVPRHGTSVHHSAIFLQQCIHGQQHPPKTSYHQHQGHSPYHPLHLPPLYPQTTNGLLLVPATPAFEKPHIQHLGPQESVYAGRLTSPPGCCLSCYCPGPTRPSLHLAV
eukprot:GHUV01034848.1.p1 GENE.GHUV01034848.1~~GHUV01034848.1.p1  ORF type:complete len:130 (-),score=11.06 GHUV01034848.1:328-717(-)